MVLPAIERQGSVEAWIIDDSGFPKHGRHPVGVARYRSTYVFVTRPGTEEISSLDDRVLRKLRIGVHGGTYADYGR